MTHDNDNAEPSRPAELFLAFSEAEALPVAAMHEAVAHWPECRDFFVSILEGYASGEYDAAEDGDALLFLIHLFGQMRETTACKPLLTLLAGPVEEVEAVLGDAVDETLPSILTGVFDGDCDALEELIRVPDLDGFVRWPLLEAYAALVHLERIGTLRAERFLLELADADLAPDDPAWNGWVFSCAAIATPALLARAREMLAGGAIAPEAYEAAEFEAACAQWRDDPERELERLQPIADAVEVLSGWHGFTEAGLAARRKAARLGASIGRDTIVNPMREIGRNDPCPCGSGRKYKKCHGA